MTKFNFASTKYIAYVGIGIIVLVGTIIISRESTIFEQVMLSTGMIIVSFVIPLMLIKSEKLTNVVLMQSKELEKANEELKRKDRLKDEFISVASHELKNPIQPILGFAHLAKKGRISQDEAWDALLQHARRLQRLANDILDVSRIESGNLTYTMEKVKINDIILDVVSNEVNLSKDVSIESKLDKNVEIEADKDRITQVLTNIIGNALKFTKKGIIMVETHVFSQTNKIEIRISDTGGGIPDDILPSLFGKFVTKSVKEGTQHGTGLGLFISKAILTAHNGEISAYNNNEGGATFTILLPISNGRVYNCITEQQQ